MAFPNALLLACAIGIILPENAYSTAWDTDWAEWRKTAYYPTMYPFNATYGDSILDPNEQNGVNPEIKYTIPFYGINHQSAIITPYGYVGIPYQLTGGFVWSNTWPNPEFPKLYDPGFAAPYYSRNGKRGSANPGTLFWRNLDARQVNEAKKKEQISGMLNEVSYQVRASVVGADLFVAKYGLVVTWKDATFEGKKCKPDDSACQRNTYQAVIVTDEMETYAIFNYYNITWIGDTIAQECNDNGGMVAGCQPAKAGFNAGEGRAFTPLPLSGNENVIDLDKYSGSNVTGRFIYKISGDIIGRGGCLNVTNPGDKSWNMTISPNHGPQLGGNLVNVSGPCFHSTQTIRCLFDDKIVTGYRNPSNPMIAHCVAPILNTRGPVKLKLSTGGNTFSYVSDYYVDQIGQFGPSVTLRNETNKDWFAMDASQLALTWKPTDLDHDKNVKVDITLFGYMEGANGQGGDWKELAKIKENVKNTDGSFTFQPKDHRCKDSNNELYDVGAIRVSVRENSDPKTRRAIWSEIIPLGWYVIDRMKSKHGNNWPQTKCEQWRSQDSKYKTWRTGLHPCPCTISQAQSSFGRWQPDLTCNIYDAATKCQFHPGAKHCVRSIHPNKEGAGNTCCYDTKGQLMFSQDNEGGSTPARNHPWGAKSSNPPRVPTMSHWLNDVIPKFFCCKWSNDCNKYLDRRQTFSCKNYKAPKHAMVYGDPHFQTFDGKSYTFNPKGEYWLLKTEVTNLEDSNRPFKVSIQGRFQQPEKQSWGEVKGTFLTAIVIQQGFTNFKDGKPVQIQCHSNQTISKRKLTVYVGGNAIEFDAGTRRQEFVDRSGQSIIIEDQSPSGLYQTNFTVILSSGVAVSVAHLNGYIHVITEVPEEAKTFTKGLFGLYDGNPKNDLTPRNSKTPVTVTSLETIHNKFGKTWFVTKDETHFIYYAKMNYEYFLNLDFKPEFSYTPNIPGNGSVTENEINSLCGKPAENGPCQYDFRVTLDKTVAENTIKSQDWFNNFEYTMAKPVLSCGFLPVPNALREATNGNLVGSKVTLEKCRCDCSLVGGKTQFTCVQKDNQTAHWVPDVSNVKCEPNNQNANRARMAAAIAVPIVLIILIALVVLAAVMIFRKRKQQQQDQKPQKGGKNDPEGGNTDKKEPYVYPRPNPTTDPKNKNPKIEEPVPAKADPNLYDNAIRPSDIELEAAVARDVALEAAAKREMALAEAARHEAALTEAAKRETELAIAARLAQEVSHRDNRGQGNTVV